MTNWFTYDDGPPYIRAVVHSSENGLTTDVAGIIDRGAEGTLLDMSIARTLGLNLTSAPVLALGGVGSGLLTGRVAIITISLLQLPELTLQIRATFAPGVGTTTGNLIGLNVWRHFDLFLSHGSLAGAISPRAGP